MTKERQKMLKKRILGILVVLVLFTTLFSAITFAADNSAVGIFGKINSFFASEGGYKDYNNIVDFLIFFILFFSAAYLGFSKWFGGEFGKPGTGKGAVLGLSISISLAMSMGLVLSGFSLAKNFAMISKNLLFFIMALLFYGLVSHKNLIGNDTWPKKIFSAFVGIFLAYIALNFLTWGVCMIESNNENPACASGGGVFKTSLIATGFMKPSIPSIGDSGSVSSGGIESKTSNIKWSDGDCKGGFRLDGTFKSKKTTLTSPSEKVIKEFTKSAGQTIIVTTFSEENNFESSGRLGKLDSIIKSAGGSSSPNSQHVGVLFNNKDASDNNRFILSTEPISTGNYVPSKLAIGKPTKCNDDGKTESITQQTPCDSFITQSEFNADYMRWKTQLDGIEKRMNQAINDKDTTSIQREITSAKEVKKHLSDLKSKFNCIQG